MSIKGERRNDEGDRPRKKKPGGKKRKRGKISSNETVLINYNRSEYQKLCQECDENTEGVG